VHPVAGLILDFRLGDVLANALQIETLGPHVQISAVARKNVRQRHRHVQPLNVRLQIIAGLGVVLIEDGLGYFVSRLWVESQQAKASVEKHRPAHDTIGDTVLDKHTAVNGPNRFELFERHQPTVQRRCTEAPCESAVRGA
jgi:hypothetical protein